MELRQLKTFITVADLLSFTRASKKLYLAQSSVSAQIKALEEELDLRLFDRIGRRILLTDAGRKLYAYARRMEEMTREIQSEFSSVRGMRACLKRGLGFTICPEISVSGDLKEKTLVRLDSRDDGSEAALIMIWHVEKWCSPLLKHFMQLSEEVMSGSM